ncbi:MAG: sugar ABC transporter permease [Candidatus Poseidoniales archaeon]|nr:MAG: sugar ABC transporter permease [Candidatus Poseidoniales archaeon]
MKRFLFFLLLCPIFFGIVSAGSVNQIELDGSVGYRQVGIEMVFSEPATNGTYYEVRMNGSEFDRTEDSRLHSVILVGDTAALMQPEIGDWYDDCHHDTGDGSIVPIHREPDGTGVVPNGTISIGCTLTGIPSGQEYYFAVLTIHPNGTEVLSPVISSSSTTEDTLAVPLKTSPYLFAIGSISLSIIALLFGLRWLDYRDGRTTSKGAHFYIAPALLSLAVLTFYPVIYGIWLALTDADQSRLGEHVYIGLENFLTVFSTSGFLRVTGFTLLWTVVNVVSHIGLGLLLALALNKSGLWGKTAYRTLLLLPWAIPSYITVLVWRGMFEPAGAINDLLGTDLNLLADANGARFAVILVNIWLGIPFMMMSISGALQALPKDMYEAAEVDGIGTLGQFRHLTLPNLRSALVPLSLLGFIWTFNMFNVIYLMTDGGPNLDFDGPGSTDILITYVYDVAFRDGAYGVAAAWSVVIFVMLVAFSWTYMKRTNATEAVT